MQKNLTLLFAFAIFVLVVGWAITPAQGGPKSKKGKGGGGGGNGKLQVNVTFRDFDCGTDGDHFCSDDGTPYKDGKRQVAAQIDKFRFGLNVGINGPRGFFLDFTNRVGACDTNVDDCPPFSMGTTVGWNVFSTSPDGAQFLKMSANGSNPDDFRDDLDFQLTFLDDDDRQWFVEFNPSTCSDSTELDTTAVANVFVTKTSDDPNTWVFETKDGDDVACLLRREGTFSFHGLYHMPFQIEVVEQ